MPTSKAKKSQSSKVVVPISGGMDSSVLLHLAAERYDKIIAVSFNYGQKHNIELLYATRQIQSVIKKIGEKNIVHKVINLPFFKDVCTVSSLLNTKIPVAKAKDVMGDPQTVNYVPFRNTMLLSICLAIAENVGASSVFHGAAQADSIAGYWDGSREFLDQINKLASLNRRNKITIQAPLIQKSKADIVKLGVKLGVNFAETWTCYEGEQIACGECTACSLRIKGFIDAGYIDPIPYKISVPWEKYKCKKIN